MRVKMFSGKVDAEGPLWAEIIQPHREVSH